MPAAHRSLLGLAVFSLAIAAADAAQAAPLPTGPESTKTFATGSLTGDAVSNTGAYTSIGTGVSFVEGDFGDFDTGPTIEDTEVRISFLGVDGTCAAPSGANAQYEDINLQVINPDGINRILIDSGSFCGGTAMGGIANNLITDAGGTFLAATETPGTPVCLGTGVPAKDTNYIATGTGIDPQFSILPAGGSLTTRYFSEQPLGTWFLQGRRATAASAQTCIYEYAVHIKAREPLANAGGPYFMVPEGFAQPMSAGASTDWGGIVKYEHKCDINDASYVDGAGTPTFNCTYADEGTGSYVMIVRTTDNDPQGALADTATAMVSVYNVAPTIPVITNKVTAIGALFSFDVDAPDPGTLDTTEFALVPTALVPPPSGMSIDTVTGVISWTPTCAHKAGSPYLVTVRATDNDLDYTERTFQITLTDGNTDADAFENCDDNCPSVANSLQENHDVSLEGIGKFNQSGDACDTDDDNDGKLDVNETTCALGVLNWDSTSLALDWDQDGCKDDDTSNEDDDDDNDGIKDNADLCDPDTGSPAGDIGASNASVKGWTSDLTNDYDVDGCQDATEDLDDDNDGLADGLDDCDRDDEVGSTNDGLPETSIDSNKGWTSNAASDQDGDGCQDSLEDADDDSDQLEDEDDDCDPDSDNTPTSKIDWDTNDPALDYDDDGCKDEGLLGEDEDDDNDGVKDNTDDCDPDNGKQSDTGWTSVVGSPGTDRDGDGCQDESDSDEDKDDDNDTRNDDVDDCDPDNGNGPNDQGITTSAFAWNAQDSTLDYDADGCQDSAEDLDDDNDLLPDTSDKCDPDIGSPASDPGNTQSVRFWISTDGALDYDGDGCKDEDISNEDDDDDNDGRLDNIDRCDPDTGVPATDIAAKNASLKGWGATTGGPTVPGNDWDADGCKDDSIGDEDDDDDNDGVKDPSDDCDPDDEMTTTKDGATEGVLASDKDWTSSDQDSDGCQDSGEDNDDDSDQRADLTDQCDPDSDNTPVSEIDWDSTSIMADYDTDGCKDADDEDADDDNDGKNDDVDACDPDTGIGAGPNDTGAVSSEKGWLSTNTGAPGGVGTDYDVDGCKDEDGTDVDLLDEDDDDDNDSMSDSSDDCDPDVEGGMTSDGAAEGRLASNLLWTSDDGGGTPGTDYDADGCQDSLEDLDDDTDLVTDLNDLCDPDAAGGDVAQTNAVITLHTLGVTSSYLGAPASDHDADGCDDEGEDEEDPDDDNDGRADATDDCDPDLEDDTTKDGADEPALASTINWDSTANANDHDADGCKDTGTGAEDGDDDSDQVLDIDDDCDPDGYASKGQVNPNITLLSAIDWDGTPGNGGSPDTDYDNDGCQDYVGMTSIQGEDTDDDDDRRPDNEDRCDPDTGSPALDKGANSSIKSTWASTNTGGTGNVGTDYDVDGCKDDDVLDEDDDDDNDGIKDPSDDCDPDDEAGLTALGGAENALASFFFVSTKGTMGAPGTDWDVDGCADGQTEDGDDDNDSQADAVDDCDPDNEGGSTADGATEGALGSDLGWTSTTGAVGSGTPGTDYDDDGCQDGGEDLDDDSDQQVDGADDCDPDGWEDISRIDPLSITGPKHWDSSLDTSPADGFPDADHDNDGCQDTDTEDVNDDNDAYGDLADICPVGVVDWDGTDYDSDGCQDGNGEETDLDNDTIPNAQDKCDPTDGDAAGGPKPDAFMSQRGQQEGFSSDPATNDRDSDGCKDQDYGFVGTEEDGDDDNDGKLDGADDCDPDGYDSQGRVNPNITLTSAIGWISVVGSPGTDYDNDGCQDGGEDADDDDDNQTDSADRCDPDLSGPLGDTGVATSDKTWDSNTGDVDDDGCRDGSAEDLDGDNDGIDDCSVATFPCPLANVTDKCVSPSTIGVCADLDGDGCCNGTQDFDDDGDGLLNSPDQCDPDAGDGSSSGTTGWTSHIGLVRDPADRDGDGCKDEGTGEEDGDDDGDGVLDAADQCDVDGPSTVGVTNWTSVVGNPGTDYDGDGCRDSDEDLDDDADGVADGADACDPDNTDSGILSSNKGAGSDYDGDGCKDSGVDNDLDDDNDGRADTVDRCDPDAALNGPVPGDTGSVSSTQGPGFNSNNPGQDREPDGCADAGEDDDDDNDGVLDVNDNCPVVANPLQEDIKTPGGAGDACDGDADGDSVLDAADNCPNVANQSQTNTDGVADGGDACDTDDDNDGDVDGADNCQLIANANQANLDGDALGDVCDSDRDGDGLSNTYECPTSLNCAAPGKLDPDKRDTDGDFIDDGTEVGSDPQTPVNTDSADETAASIPLVIDALDLNSDGDILTDAQEAGDTDLNTPPKNTDKNFIGGDLVPDYQDTDSDADTVDEIAVLPNDLGDNCPVDANTNQADLDGNDVGDVCDPDADGDGLSNVIEGNLGTNPLLFDTDGDFIQDGVEVGPDPLLAFNTDSDNPKVIDALDADSDDDGLSDASEAGDTTYLTAARNTDLVDLPDYRDTDSDNDGVPDNLDNCVLIINNAQTNSDALLVGGDLLGDACDGDDDADTVLDGADNCSTVPNLNQLNTDATFLASATPLMPVGDLLGDACDPDDDADGDLDGADNCVLTRNASQADLDTDGTGDACDSDTDGDTIANGADNCPSVSNLDQLNTDFTLTVGSDGLGDACDADDDGDGDLDGADNCPIKPNSSQLNTDSALANGDNDGDACDDDDDADSVLDTTDNCTVIPNLDQLNTDKLLTDGDALGDACDLDDDADGDLDTADNCPLITNADQANSDSANDGGDACDTDDDNDTILDTSDTCPTVSSANQTDTDGDGDGNLCDPDDDGDKVPDVTDNCLLLKNKDQADWNKDGEGDVCDNDVMPEPDPTEEDAGVEPTPDAGAQVDAGGAGGTGGKPGRDAGTLVDGGTRPIECTTEALLDAAKVTRPEVLNRKNIEDALLEAGFTIPDDAGIDDVKQALAERDIVLPEGCDLQTLLEGELADAGLVYEKDSGCGCRTVGGSSDLNGLGAALMTGLAVVLGYRRRRRNP